MSSSVLVTGANGSIGHAIARKFLEAGSDQKVLLGVRSKRSNAEELAAQFPERARLVTLDVTDAENWEAVVQDARESGQPVSVLVNNAGFHSDHLLASMPAKDWHQVIESNLTATFHGCQSVLRGMMAQRMGRIINISSLSALLAPLGQTNYAAAKAGVVALTQSLAKETARMRITVNAICPGYIESDSTYSMSSDQQKATKRSIPMRRFGTPEEVAAAVFFLASEDAAYITGSILKIDGGIF